MVYVLLVGVGSIRALVGSHARGARRVLGLLSGAQGTLEGLGCAVGLVAWDVRRSSSEREQNGAPDAFFLI
jgi:hypothetical protein